MSNKTKYDWWLYWLKKLGITYGFWKEDVILCPKSWKAYFDEGLTIAEAVTEDFKHA